MLILKEYKPNTYTNTYLLEFSGYYGDMDYDYDASFYISDNDKNKNIIEQILKKLPEKPYGCSASQEFSSKISEILQQIEDESVYISTDMSGNWYPSWDLTVYYFDENGKKFEVRYKEDK